MVRVIYLPCSKQMLILFLLIVIFGGFAQATDYYVDNQNASANDTNPGTQALPFKTIQKCADTAIAGDTCYVEPGTYDEHVQTTKSGTASNPSECIPISGTYPNYTINPPCQAQRITFKAQGKVTMKGFNIKNSFITIEGFDITNYGGKYYGHINIFPGGDYCQILNNTIRDGIDGVHGIYEPLRKARENRGF